MKRLKLAMKCAVKAKYCFKTRSIGLHCCTKTIKSTSKGQTAGDTEISIGFPAALPPALCVSIDTTGNWLPTPAHHSPQWQPSVSPLHHPCAPRFPFLLVCREWTEPKPICRLFTRFSFCNENKAKKKVPGFKRTGWGTSIACRCEYERDCGRVRKPTSTGHIYQVRPHLMWCGEVQKLGEAKFSLELFFF